MTPTEIETTFLHTLAEIAPEADLSKVPRGADLRDALDLDSMDVVRLVSMLHQALAVDIPEADTGRLLTIAGAVEYLSRSRSTRG